MGMFGKLFGSKIEYPPLPAENAAMARLDAVMDQLEELAQRVNDHLEIVPAEQEAYVYLGHPPKRFGMAWIHDGKVSSINELVGDNKLTQRDAQKLVVELGHAYEHASDAPRYSAEVAGKTVVVIPSKGLGEEVHQIIEGAIH